MDWMDDAACGESDTDTFFTADDFTHPELTYSEIGSLNAERTLRARVICSSCPVQRECLQYGNQYDAGRDALNGYGFFGTYAGITGGQRARGVNPAGYSTPPAEIAARIHSPKFDMALAMFRGGASLQEAADAHGVSVKYLQYKARATLVDAFTLRDTA